MRRTDVVEILCVVGVKGRHDWSRDTEGKVRSELDGLFGRGERSRSLTTQKVQVQFFSGLTTRTQATSPSSSLECNQRGGCGDEECAYWSFLTWDWLAGEADQSRFNLPSARTCLSLQEEESTIEKSEGISRQALDRT